MMSRDVLAVNFSSLRRPQEGSSSWKVGVTRLRARGPAQGTESGSRPLEWTTTNRAVEGSADPTFSSSFIEMSRCMQALCRRSPGFGQSHFCGKLL